VGLDTLYLLFTFIFQYVICLFLVLRFYSKFDATVSRGTINYVIDEFRTFPTVD
jgi:hypothetical protein